MDASAAAAAAALLLAVVLVVLRAARRRGRVAALLQRARAKKETARAAQVAYLRELGPVDAEVDAAAAGLTARAIAAGVQRGSLDAAAVLRAFCARAVAAHERTNCLTEHLFTRAFAAVQTLAELGPASRSLMGVPVSLKDTVGVSGFDTSNGLVRFVAQPAAADAVVVRLLSARGALPFCKTNVPQTLLSFECKNPLWGRTTNPWNTAYTPGGSSGGESALIAAGGSVLGVGSDIGGSLRIPAHMAGIVALKPTDRRVSSVGCRPSVAGQEAVPGTVGPMAPAGHVDSLGLFMEAVCVEEAWRMDAHLVPIPWNAQECGRTDRLKVAVFDGVPGLLPVSPACQRAVQEAAAALRAAGHEVVSWTPPGLEEAAWLYLALLTSDGGKTVMAHLVDDVHEDYVTRLFTSVALPRAVKWTLARVWSALGWHWEARLMEGMGERSVQRLWHMTARRKELRQAAAQAWRAQQFDVLLGPAHCLPATPHGTYKDISFSAWPTFVFNLLDWPAGVVPVSRVKPTDDALYARGPGLVRKALRRCYEPAAQAGLPLGVQLVGLPYCDETVVRAMRALERALPFRAHSSNVS